MFYQNPKLPTPAPVVKDTLFGQSQISKLTLFQRKKKFQDLIGPRDERDYLETVTPAPRVPDSNPTDQTPGAATYARV